MLQERKGITIRSEVIGQINFIFVLPVSETPLHMFHGPTSILGRIYRTEKVSARAGVVVPAANRFGSVNPPENTRVYQEMRGVGFRVRESDYEVSFGLAHQD